MTYNRGTKHSSNSYTIPGLLDNLIRKQAEKRRNAEKLHYGGKMSPQRWQYPKS